jgi:APA family basic amino acid/polyamine antiporter
LTIFPEINNDWLRKIIACSLIVILAFIHSSNRKSSGGLQMIFTVMKVGVIILFCFGAILFAKNIQPVSFSPNSNDISTIFSGSFAVSLIYVSYAYTGWNAATYLSSEIERPQKYLPLILISGTTIVTVLYILLNFVFLSVAPIEDMQGKIEIGFIAAQSAFGGSVANFTGLVLSLLLISTVSAMTIAGPRVLQVIGEDFKVLNILSIKREDGIPSTAIYIQSLIAIIFILSSSFESILVFAGFTLALNSFVTVIAVFVLRSKQPNLPRPYKTFGYPFTPLIYLALTGWTLYFVIINRPIEVLFSLGIILSGLIFYYISNRKNY